MHIALPGPRSNDCEWHPPAYNARFFLRHWFWGVGRQIVNLDVPAMPGKPIPNLLVLVIGGVVLDQVDFARKVASKQFLQIDDIGGSIEDLLKMVKETGRIKLDSAKDFQSLLLPGGGNLGLASYPRPGLVESGVLPESGFVLEKEGGSFAFGFFLMSG